MNKKLKLWCIAKYNSLPQYGPGSPLAQMAPYFKAMGADVLLIASDANHLATYPSTDQVYNEEVHEDFTYLWIKTYQYSKSASFKRFISWFDFEYKLFRLDRSHYAKPDAVIVSSLSLLTVIYGLYLKKIYHCKLIFEIRDIYPLTLTEELGVSRWNPMVLFLGWIERLGYRKADLIVGTMPNLEEHVRGVSGLEKTVFHSPLGISERWVGDAVADKAVDALFPADRFVVGYAGSMSISNNLGPFIETIKSLVNDEQIYFVMVGSGDMKEKYKQELADCSNVTVGPKINPQLIPYFLSKCDLLYLAVHDSRVWRYGQSLNKLIDYMMAAKPVVASYSGYQSMLNEAGAGLFVPTGDRDAIIRAIKFFMTMDPQEREKYGQRGRQWVLEHHSYENLARKYFEKISDLVNG